MKSELISRRRQAAELAYDLGKYAKMNPRWTKQQRGIIAAALVDVVAHALYDGGDGISSRALMEQRLAELQAGPHRFRWWKREAAHDQALRTAMWMSGQASIIRVRQKDKLVD